MKRVYTQPETIRFISRMAFFILLAAAMFLSLADPGKTPGLDLTWDKLNHAFGYFALVGFLDLGFRTGRSIFPKSILVFSYSLFLECAQYFIPYREFSLFDLAANAVGIASFLILRFQLERISIYCSLRE